jgi:hypothetical protein
MNFNTLTNSSIETGVVIFAVVYIISIILTAVICNLCHKFNDARKNKNEIKNEVTHNDEYILKGRYLGKMELYLSEINSLLKTVKKNNPERLPLLKQQTKSVTDMYGSLKYSDSMDTFVATAYHMESLIISLCFMTDESIPPYITLPTEEDGKAKEKKINIPFVSGTETGSVLNMPSSESIKELGNKLSRDYAIVEEEDDGLNESWD